MKLTDVAAAAGAAASAAAYVESTEKIVVETRVLVVAETAAAASASDQNFCFPNYSMCCSDGFFKEFLQKFSICAAVAAAAGALRAAGLGTAARGPPLRRRRPHNLKIFEILNVWLRKFWPEISPNGVRTDPQRPI